MHRILKKRLTIWIKFKSRRKTPVNLLAHVCCGFVYRKDMTQTLTIPRPDDWHLHLRDGDMLAAVLPETSRDFGRAIIMPNLVPPVVTGDQARAYRDRILAALPEGDDFTPLMTLYLTEDTDPNDLAAAFESGLIRAVKLYPAGATTNSASGVRNFEKVRHVLEKMAEIGCPLCVHGEVTTADVDIFDREAVFIDTVLDPLRRSIPGLRVVMEHITTKDGVDYAMAGDDTLGATITTHHLIINRNHILVGGIKPHYYCLPVAKRETHRLALRARPPAATNAFSLALTVRRILIISKNTHAAARDVLPPPIPCPSWPMCLKKKTRFKTLPPLPRKTALRFTACPSTPQR